MTQNILQSHPDIQAIFACNDVMALGAVEAVAAAGKTKDIAIVGFDAQDDARTHYVRAEWRQRLRRILARWGGWR